MSTIDERDVDPMEALIRIAQTSLELESWGFHESYRSISLGSLIYDSEWCRIKLLWDGWDAIVGNSIYIRYGRLHASNEKATVSWMGEECRCWHDFNQALHFLDGHTPAEAAELDYSHSITDPFYEESFRQKFARRQPEWLALMQLTIWQYYGVRFFELFDLRRPELWHEYQQFLKEVYDIKGRSRAIKPPLDKVC